MSLRFALFVVRLLLRLQTVNCGHEIRRLRWVCHVHGWSAGRVPMRDRGGGDLDIRKQGSKWVKESLALVGMSQLRVNI
jgi:hypothetical protein